MSVCRRKRILYGYAKQESVTSLKGHAAQQYAHKKNAAKHGGKASPATATTTTMHHHHQTMAAMTMGDSISVTDPHQLGGYGGGLPDYQESNSGSYSTTTTISINKNDLLAGRTMGSGGGGGQNCNGSLIAIPNHTR